MNYINTTTLAQLSEGEIRALNPNVSFSTPFTPPAGYAVVFEGAQATTVYPYQISQRAGVEKISGKWYTKYVAGPVFTDQPAAGDRPAVTAVQQEAAYRALKDEEQSKAIRESRKTRLAECDWTQVADAPVDKLVWAAYRQALRDITAQPGFPWTITWPAQP